MTGGTSTESSEKGGTYKVSKRNLKWKMTEWHLTNKRRNRQVKSRNGNRGGGVKQTLKIAHWNAGPGWWEHKKVEIESLLLESEPDMLFISEANLRADTSMELREVQGYYLVTPNTELYMNYSRIVLLAREGVILTILNECMSNNIPEIWVKVSTRGRKPIVVGGVYREFHHLLQPPPNTSDDWGQQITRWKKTLENWKKAAKNTKCVVFGDCNIDYKKWNDPNYRLKKLVDLTKTEIEPQGFCQLIEEYTRFWPGQTSSTVDHLWTNSVGSIMSTRNQTRSSSDHNVVSAIIRTKDRREHGHDMIKRDRSKFNLARFKSRIQDIDWSEFFRSRDINILNDIFVQKVGTILEEEAPLKTFQARKNHKNWLTNELKIKMKERDLKREQARTSGDRNTWGEYRKKRNECTKMLKKVKNDSFFRTF